MKSRKSSVRRVTVAWSDDLRALFKLTAGWSAPATVLVRQNRRTWTFIADFRDEGGRAIRQITRTSVPDRKGEVEVLSEELTVSLRVGARR